MSSPNGFPRKATLENGDRKIETAFKTLIRNARACHACSGLPLGPRPVFQASPSARLLIVGQAPGLKVHRTGIPWDDASGERLREWLGLSKEIFYDEKRVAILPVGFCYPGTGERGDLPPRKECFPLWHEKFLSQMSELQLTVLLGQYAHAAYLGKSRKANLSETVRAWREYLPRYLPLPHSSPLNNIWLAKNRWFEKDLRDIRQICQHSLLKRP